jgi:twinkle protein
MTDIPVNTERFTAAYKNLKYENQLHPASDYMEEVYDFLNNPEKGTPCVFAPNLRFRPGDTTIVAGINSHGKSMLTAQIGLQLVHAGHKVAFLSFEMRPSDQILRLTAQAVRGNPSVDDVKQFNAVYGEVVYFLGYVGSMTPMQTLGAIIVAAQDYGCDYVFVDPLMSVVLSEDDITQQKFFIQNVSELARRLNIHTFVVCHARKGKTESDPIGKFDVRGSSAIVDLADNAIIIQRDMEKARKIDRGEYNPNNDPKEADVFLRVVKQRHYSWQGEVKLWFNYDRLAFCMDSNREPALGKKTR